MQWFGLNWFDIFLNVLVLAIVPGIVAAYGGHLAAEVVDDAKRRGKIKASFWGLFILGVIFTSWQQLRLAEADLARETKSTWDEALLNRAFFAPGLPAPLPLNAPPGHVPKPDIGMEFINPGDVAFRMVNLSNVTLRDPKYYFVLTDLDAPRTVNINGTMVSQILPIPAFTDAGDFLKPKAKFLGRAIVSTFPAVQSLVKPNDRICGTATVSCPDCLRDRHYFLYFVVGSGGWYYEVPDYALPSWPKNRPRVVMGDEELQKLLQKLAPLDKRIQIVPDT